MRLFCLLLFVAASYAAPSVPIVKDDNPLCDYCVKEMGLLFNNNTLNTLLTESADVMCQAVPFIQDKCEGFVGKYMQKLIDMALDFGAQGACKGIKLCSDGPAVEMQVDTIVVANIVKLHHSVDQQLFKSGADPSGGCLGCQFAVASIRAMLTSNQVQTDLQQLMLAACKVGDPFEVKACENFVNQYWGSIFRALSSSINEQLLCEDTNVCV